MQFDLLMDETYVIVERIKLQAFAEWTGYRCIRLGGNIGV